MMLTLRCQSRALDVAAAFLASHGDYDKIFIYSRNVPPNANNETVEYIITTVDLSKNEFFALQTIERDPLRQQMKHSHPYRVTYKDLTELNGIDIKLP